MNFCVRQSIFGAIIFFSLTTIGQNITLSPEKKQRIYLPMFLLEISDEDFSGKSLPLTFKGKQIASDFPFKKEKGYYFYYQFDNPTKNDAEYFLYAGDWAFIEARIWNNTEKTWTTLKQGRFLPYSERNALFPYISLQFEAQTQYILILRLEERMDFYLQNKKIFFLKTASEAAQANQQRLFYQGIFLGIIMVMGLYNLLIYFSVKDRSFLYYVFSIVGLGMYFMFYYGFFIEFFWQNAPIWNAYSFILIVPLTRIAWILFTQHYLHLDKILPFWDKLLNILIIFYSLPMITGLISWQTSWDLSTFTVNSIGVLGVVVLSLMLWLGILAWRKGFAPARYFVIANIIFSIGSILFILREINLIGDFFLTKYSVQFGVTAQVVLFSLGLGARLREAREQLALRDLEKERLKREKEIERKKLIEQQKIELEQLVEQRTADLQKKTSELEQAFTQLQQSEQNFRELNHLKDQFFSIISHDLRSPLATLHAFLNLLTNFSDTLSQEDYKKLTLKTQQSLNNLSALLDNLLIWATNQMGAMAFNPETITINEVLQENVQLLQTSAELKNIQLQTYLSETIWIVADRNMLSFIIRNLLFNAIKFTKEGGSVTIRTLQTGKQACISVEDNGVGISEENLKKLFDQQQNITTRGTHNEKGIGLGLRLCKEFILKHQGKLTVQSQVQKGTTFQVELPIDKKITRTLQTEKPLSEPNGY